MSIGFRRPPNVWVICAPVAYILGAAISFSMASATVDRGTTAEEVISILTTFLLIGLFFAGVGQLMRAAAHGATSRGGKLVDGWGKIVGLFGWSLGLVAAVMFATRDAETPELLISVAVIVVLVVPVIALLAAVITRK